MQNEDSVKEKKGSSCQMGSATLDFILQMYFQLLLVLLLLLPLLVPSSFILGVLFASKFTLLNIYLHFLFNLCSNFQGPERPIKFT